MTELYDYTVAEVMELPAEEASEYYALSRALKPRDVLGIGKLADKPYGYIKTMQSSRTYNEPEMLAKLLHERPVTAEDIVEIVDMRFMEYGYQWRYIAAQLEELTAKEISTLRSEPTADEQAAGVDALERFGVFGTIDTLAGGDVLKYKDIEAMPYSVIFAKLYLEKESAAYNRRYAKVIDRKSNI